MNKVDLSQFKSNLSLKNRLARLIWGWVWLFLFRPSPRIAFFWRSWLLKAFGAKLGGGVRVYNSAKIFLPGNLFLGDRVVVGPEVDLYCVAPIRIGSDSMISQYSYLCAATHDYRQAHLPLIARPIEIGSEAWICADAFIGPGVVIGDRAVVGARSVVTKDVAAKSVVAGNPAAKIKDRD